MQVEGREKIGANNLGFEYVCIYIYYIYVSIEIPNCVLFFDFHQNEVNCWKGGYGKRMPGTDLRLHRKDLLSSLSFPESGWFVAVLLDSRVEKRSDHRVLVPHQTAETRQ